MFHPSLIDHGCSPTGALLLQGSFFHIISEDEDRHYPHRCWGQVDSQITPVIEAQQGRMISMMELLAITNSELNAALLELK